MKMEHHTTINMSQRKTLKQKEAAGTLQPARDKKKEKEIQIEKVDKVEQFDGWFDEDDTKIFDELNVVIAQMGSLASGDKLAINLLMDSYKRYVQLREEIKKTGYLIKWGETKKANPLLTSMDSAFNQMTRLCSEFGLTPRSRSKLFATGDVEVGEQDPLSIWLAKKNN